MEALQEISVPRCLQESRREKSVSVQTFVDASSEAYGAVSYLRSEYSQGSYVVWIIASKTRVCPLTPMSIPRLELMAAVLGLRLTLSILAALDISIGHARFWSDSMNVLYWIRGKGKQYLHLWQTESGRSKVSQTRSSGNTWKRMRILLIYVLVVFQRRVLKTTPYGGEGPIFWRSTSLNGQRLRLKKDQKWRWKPRKS